MVPYLLDVPSTPSAFEVSGLTQSPQSLTFTLNVMRTALTTCGCLFVLLCVAHAVPEPVDLTRKPEASYHKYVGRRVTVSGRFSQGGKFGTLIKTGKAQVYLISDSPHRSSDAALEGQRVIVLGTLRIRAGNPSRDPSVAGAPAYYYFRRSECTLQQLFAR
jgi:hypothetical protein